VIRVLASARAKYFAQMKFQSPDEWNGLRTKTNDFIFCFIYRPKRTISENVQRTEDAGLTYKELDILQLQDIKDFGSLPLGHLEELSTWDETDKNAEYYNDS
jgi:hypothetical protein